MDRPDDDVPFLIQVHASFPDEGAESVGGRMLPLAPACMDADAGGAFDHVLVECQDGKSSLVAFRRNMDGVIRWVFESR